MYVINNSNKVNKSKKSSYIHKKSFFNFVDVSECKYGIKKIPEIFFIKKKKKSVDKKN